MDYLSKLHPKLLINICRRVSEKDLVHMRLTCTRINNFANKNLKSLQKTFYHAIEVNYCADENRYYVNFHRHITDVKSHDRYILDLDNKCLINALKWLCFRRLTITGFIPITDEFLKDIAYAVQYTNVRPKIIEITKAIFEQSSSSFLHFLKIFNTRIDKLSIEFYCFDNRTIEARDVANRTIIETMDFVKTHAIDELVLINSFRAPLDSSGFGSCALQTILNHSSSIELSVYGKSTFTVRGIADFAESWMVDEFASRCGSIYIDLRKLSIEMYYIRRELEARHIGLCDDIENNSIAMPHRWFRNLFLLFHFVSSYYSSRPYKLAISVRKVENYENQFNSIMVSEKVRR